MFGIMYSSSWILWPSSQFPGWQGWWWTQYCLRWFDTRWLPIGFHNVQPASWHYQLARKHQCITISVDGYHNIILSTKIISARYQHPTDVKVLKTEQVILSVPFSSTWSFPQARLLKWYLHGWYMTAKSLTCMTACQRFLSPSNM